MYLVIYSNKTSTYFTNILQRWYYPSYVNIIKYLKKTSECYYFAQPQDYESRYFLSVFSDDDTVGNELLHHDVQ